jgi:hypothetical protein
MSKNSKTAIQEIKNLMKQFGFLSEDVTLASFKLEDNTILEAKELKVGESITKINELFEKVALESGSYRLVENFEIEVEEGKIVAVKEIFLDAKLADGTQIKVAGDMLEPGAKVVVVTEQGEIPAPDAIHELEDGTKVETKDGIIVKVEEVAQEAMAAIDAPVDGTEVTPPATEDISAPVEVEMIEMLKDFVKKMSEKMEAMETQMKSVQSEFKAFKKEPAAKKIADGKVEQFNNQSSETDDKIAGIMKLRKMNK